VHSNVRSRAANNPLCISSLRSKEANSPCALCTSRSRLVDAGCLAKQRWTGLPTSASHSTSSQQLPSLRSDFPNIPTHFPYALLHAALTCCTSVVCFSAYPAVQLQEPVVSISHLHPVIINNLESESWHQFSQGNHSCCSSAPTCVLLLQSAKSCSA